MLSARARSSGARGEATLNRREQTASDVEAERSRVSGFGGRQAWAAIKLYGRYIGAAAAVVIIWVLFAGESASVGVNIDTNITENEKDPVVHLGSSSPAEAVKEDAEEQEDTGVAETMSANDVLQWQRELSRAQAKSASHSWTLEERIRVLEEEVVAARGDCAHRVRDVEASASAAVASWAEADLKARQLAQIVKELEQQLYYRDENGDGKAERSPRAPQQSVMPRREEVHFRRRASVAMSWHLRGANEHMKLVEEAGDGIAGGIDAWVGEGLVGGVGTGCVKRPSALDVYLDAQPNADELHALVARARRGAVDADDGLVLVLGSGGVVGRALVPALESRGHTVLQVWVVTLKDYGSAKEQSYAQLPGMLACYVIEHVQGRYSMDLRVKGALDMFKYAACCTWRPSSRITVPSELPIRFVFVLAGDTLRWKPTSYSATFLGSTHARTYERNSRIVKSLSQWLRKTDVPFLATTRAFSSAYAQARTDLEELVASSTVNGKMVRLWDVVGDEGVSERSSVVLDLVASCLERGEAKFFADPEEPLLGPVAISSAGDIARVLVHIMDDFSTKYSHRDIIDVAAEQWIDFEEELIPMIEEMTRCHISHQKPEVGQYRASFFRSNVRVNVPVDVSVVGKNVPELLPGHPVPLVPTSIRKLLSEEYGTNSPQQVIRNAIRWHTRRRGASAAGCTPYMSSVIVGRNDEYGVGFVDRMQNYIDVFAWQAQRYSVCVELVVVEYDPPPDRVPLAEALRWPEINGGARVVTIRPGVGEKRVFTEEKLVMYVPDDDLRQSFRDFGPLVVYEYVAKNAGARRARGKWILVGNADSILSHPIWEALAKQQLHPTHMYRAERRDAADSVKSGELDPADLYARLTKSVDTVTDTVAPSFVQFMEQADMVYLLNSGDFVIVSKERMEQLHGHPEAPYNTHIDSLAMLKFAAHPAGAFQVILESPILHQPHKTGLSLRPKVPLQQIEQWGREMMCRGVDRFLDYDWGLGDATASSVSVCAVGRDGTCTTLGT